MSRGLRMSVEEFKSRAELQSLHAESLAIAAPNVIAAVMRTAGKYYTLPYPPSVNTYWRNIGAGRTILSKRAREYRKSVLAIVGPAKPWLKRLAVSIILYPPDKRKRDLDNAFKGVLDGLAHACVYRDDEQIDELTIKRGPVIKGGKCEVTIRELPCAAKN